jgi:GntR family transcriptional regulator
VSGEPTIEDTAKYLVIADELRTQIMSGAVAPGARLPGENELIRRHGVARMTARQALSVLQSEGLTVARKGAGVFVRDFRPARRRVWDRSGAPAPAPDREVRSPFPTRNDGRTPALDQVRVYPDAATPVVAGALGLEPGTVVWVRNRTFMLDGKPVMLAVSYLPADVVDGSPITEQDPGPGGTYARLAELGHAPARVTEELRARMPMRYEAADLKLPPGTAVIVLCRTAFDTDGRPIEFIKMTLDADAYVLEYGLHA